MPNAETFDQIIASAVQARKELSELEQCLQGEIDDIDFGAFEAGRPLTADEKARRREFRTSQIEVRDAFVELAFVTVRRLDNSQKLAALQRRLDIINLGLSDDLERLAQLERFSAIVAKVTDTFAKVLGKVAETAADVVL